MAKVDVDLQGCWDIRCFLCESKEGLHHGWCWWWIQHVSNKFRDLTLFQPISICFIKVFIRFSSPQKTYKGMISTNMDDDPYHNSQGWNNGFSLWVEEITGKPFHQKQHWPHTAWCLPLIGLKQLKPAFLKTGKCYEIRFWDFTVDVLFESTSSIVDKSIADVLQFVSAFPCFGFLPKAYLLPFHLFVSCSIPFSNFCSMTILNSKKIYTCFSYIIL